jgi:hypothetical protein
MPIDRNARARLFARIQADRSLTLGARAVARAIVASCDGKGRTRRTYDAIARLAGVDRRTVSRALPQIEHRLVDVHRTREPRRGRNGGTVLARGVNLYLVRDLPAATAHKGQDATETTNQQKPVEQAPLDPALAAVLARLGTAIADRRDRQQDDVPHQRRTATC